MPHIHTHYDNLKVSRDAPPEVIRAAYKTLSQKFHPDRNPGKPGATRTFQLISLAYEVLSDPVRRRDHDDWIAKQEALEAEPDRTAAAGAPAGFSGKRDSPYPDPHAWRRRVQDFQLAIKMSSARARLGHALHLLAWCVVATIILFGILSG
ncbi:MAG: J domain-containing protein [Noviherbaspirillum sp.]